MNKVTEKGTFISKSEAVMLQAVAVMLMVWHHLFGFPERIAVPYVLVFDFLFHIETLVALYGRVCVAIFAFCSGYGMYKWVLNSPKKISLFCSYRMILSRIRKFYESYWIVFVVFITIGFLLKVYSFDISQFLLGVFGFGTDYNKEWWYVGYYVLFLLLFPAISSLALLATLKPAIKHIGMLITLVIVSFVPDETFYTNFLHPLTCSLVGMYFVDCGVFEWADKLLSGRPGLRIAAGCILLGATIALRRMGIENYVLTPCFIFVIMMFLKCEPVMRWLRPVLMYVGKYSNYVWLTHSFFVYYFFEKITFFPRYSILIFAWCMVLSCFSGVVLDWLLSVIRKAFRKDAIQKSGSKK